MEITRIITYTRYRQTRDGISVVASKSNKVNRLYSKPFEMLQRLLLRIGVWRKKTWNNLCEKAKAIVRFLVHHKKAAWGALVFTISIIGADGYFSIIDRYEKLYLDVQYLDTNTFMMPYHADYFREPYKSMQRLCLVFCYLDIINTGHSNVTLKKVTFNYTYRETDYQAEAREFPNHYMGSSGQDLKISHLTNPNSVVIKDWIGIKSALFTKQPIEPGQPIFGSAAFMLADGLTRPHEIKNAYFEVYDYSNRSAKQPIEVKWQWITLADKGWVIDHRVVDPLKSN